MLFLTFALNAAAGSAKEQLQGTMDRVIEVLRTIRNPEDIERNRNSLRQILLTRFDFAAMAQKSLGNRWNDLKGKEEEFVSAFTDFVEHSYMSTLGSYRGEKIVYDRDRANGESAQVDTRVVGGQGNPIKIEYKLHLTDGQWMVYDAVIDGRQPRRKLSVSVRENSSDGLVGGIDSKPARESIRPLVESGFRELTDAANRQGLAGTRCWGERVEA